jgi:hypothetical protein
MFECIHLPTRATFCIPWAVQMFFQLQNIFVVFSKKIMSVLNMTYLNDCTWPYLLLVDKLRKFLLRMYNIAVDYPLLNYKHITPAGQVLEFFPLNYKL